MAAHKPARKKGLRSAEGETPAGSRQGGQGGFGLGQGIIPGRKPAQEDPELAQQKHGQEQLPVGLLFGDAQGS